MLITVSVISGNPAGPASFWLKPGHTIRVGRDPHVSDVVYEQDSKLSCAHFSLECSDDGVVVRDLNSEAGTILNGEQVHVARLRHGDELQAGETCFRISTERSSSRSTARATDTPPLNAAAAAATAVDQGVILYEQETCESKLVMMRGGRIGEPNQPRSPSHLTRLIAPQLSQYLIIDFRRVNVAIPDELVVHPLFDWLPNEVAAENSPQLVQRTESMDLDEIIDAGWDHDAVICLYSAQGFDEILKHLCATLRLDNAGQVETEPTSMLGYCWPVVLSQLLKYRADDFVSSLLNGIEIVLTEIPDLPGTWQLFASGSIVQSIEKAGFQVLTSESIGN